MKFIPDTLGRKLGEQGLLVSEKAPKLLFVGGVVGMVGSTVLACRATLKVEGILDELEVEKRSHDRAKDYVEENGGETPRGETYSDAEYHQDVRSITIKSAGRIARLYAPAVLLGGASIFALSKSHSILQDRNLALTAAYAAVDTAYNRYRSRVIDRYGEEVDKEIYYESEQIDTVDEETGEVISRTIATDAPGSSYRRFFDQDSSRNWSPHADINVVFLRSVQNQVNDLLRARGHVFLNEVFDALGLSHTRTGAAVGWRWNKESGDDYIDFGIWDGTKEVVNDFFNGREGAVLLDFNVDGPIWDKIDQGVV